MSQTLLLMLTFQIFAADAMQTSSDDDTVSCVDSEAEFQLMFDEDIEEQDNVAVPTLIDVAISPQQIIERMLVPIDSPTTQPYNTYLQSIHLPLLSDVITHLISQMQSLFMSRFKSKTVSQLSPEDWFQFDTDIKKHAMDDTYKNIISQKLPNHSKRPLVGGLIMLEVRKLFKQNKLANQQTNTSRHDTLNTIPNDSKMRYIGSYCIQGTKKEIHITMQRNRESKCWAAQAYVKNRALHTQLDLFHHITTTQQCILKTSKYLHSLADTIDNNTSGALTHITDICFEFFRALESRRRVLQINHSSDGIKGPQIIQQTLLNDLDLYQQWVKCFFKFQPTYPDKEYSSGVHQSSEVEAEIVVTAVTDTAVNIKELFYQVVNKYMRVSIKELMKRLEVALGQKKQMEHRKNVLTSSKKLSHTSLSIKLKDIDDDSSDKKIVSHMKLRLLAIENKTFFETFNKSELLTISQYYNLQDECKNVTKRHMVATLCEAISKQSSMPQCNIVRETKTVQDSKTSNNDESDQTIDAIFGDDIEIFHPSGTMTHAIPQSPNPLETSTCAESSQLLTETSVVIKRKGPFTLQDIINDKSAGKADSHTRLQLMCKRTDLFHTFTASHLSTLGRYYNTNIPMQQKKSKSVSQLVKIISEIDIMPNPPSCSKYSEPQSKSTHVRITDSTESTLHLSLAADVSCRKNTKRHTPESIASFSTVASNATRKSERKRTLKSIQSIGYVSPCDIVKRKKKDVQCPPVIEAEYFCGSCGAKYIDPDPLDICDNCDKWYHYTCGDLTQSQFKHLKSQDSWHCPSCKPKCIK